MTTFEFRKYGIGDRAKNHLVIYLFSKDLQLTLSYDRPICIILQNTSSWKVLDNLSNADSRLWTCFTNRDSSWNRYRTRDLINFSRIINELVT